MTTTVVSTDYENIRQVALEYGAQVPFLRPAELASDTAHSPDVVEHAVRYYEEQLNQKHDIVIMLQPTSPFRTAQHIDEAIEKFLQDPTLDSLITVKKSEYPPWWMFKADGSRLKGVLEIPGRDVFLMERQEFPVVYAANGGVHVTRRDYLKKTGCLVNSKNNGFYVMSEEDSIDIDTQTDMDLAEIELKRRAVRV